MTGIGYMRIATTTKRYLDRFIYIHEELVDPSVLSPPLFATCPRAEDSLSFQCLTRKLNRVVTEAKL